MLQNLGFGGTRISFEVTKTATMHPMSDMTAEGYSGFEPAAPEILAAAASPAHDQDDSGSRTR